MSTESTSSVVPRKILINFQGISKSEIIDLSKVASSPDPNGCVDGTYFHELLNGSYTRYLKGNGQVSYRVSDQKFWQDAGVPASYLFDPRLLFVTGAGPNGKGILFACQLSSYEILLATKDPYREDTRWVGTRIKTSGIPDLPRVGYDPNSLSIVISTGPQDTYEQEIRYFPRKDATSVPPVITNVRTFKYSRQQAGETLHPVLDRSGTKRRYAFYIGIDTTGNVGLTYGYLDHRNPQSGLVFDKIAVKDFSYVANRAHQPTDALNNPSLVFGGSGIATPPFRFGDDIWVVQHVLIDHAYKNIGIRWYRLKVDENASAPLSLAASGYIKSADNSFDYFNASIIQMGSNVVLCCNRSGNDYTSSRPIDRDCGNAGMYAIYLQPDGEFEEQVIRAGLVANYTSTSKWGDYSTVCVDPEVKDTIWMINQFVLKGGLPKDSDYATQIAAIQF
jgi:hypothetical protein